MVQHPLERSVCDHDEHIVFRDDYSMGLLELPRQPCVVERQYGMHYGNRKPHGIYVCDVSNYYKSIMDKDEQWRSRKTDHLMATQENTHFYINTTRHGRVPQDVYDPHSGDQKSDDNRVITDWRGAT